MGDFKRKLFQKRMILLIALFVLVCFFIIICSNRAFEYATDKNDISGLHTMQPGETVTQGMTLPSGELNAVAIDFGTYQRVNTGVFTIAFCQEGTPIRTSTIDSAYLTDGAYHKIYFDIPVQISPAHQYSIEITYNYEKETNAVALWTSTSGNDLSSSHGEISDQTLCYQLFLVNSKLRNWAVGIYLAALLLLFIHFLKTVNIEKLNIVKIVIMVVIFIASFQIIVTDLFQRLKIDIPVKPYTDLQSSVAIEPDESFEATVGTEFTKYNRLSFFVSEGDLTKINVKLINTDSGMEYMDRRIEPYEIIQEPTTGKNAVSVYAERVGVDAFPKGHYAIEITNASSEVPLIIEAKADETAGHTISTVLTARTWTSYRIASFLILLITLYLYVIFWYSHKGKLTPEKFFIVTVIPLGIVYFILMQPWSAPDTTAHFKAAYRLANLLLGHTENNGWVIRNDDCIFYNNVWLTASKNPSMQSILGILYNAGIKDRFIVQNASLIEHPDPSFYMECYSIISYFPVTIGFVFASILQLGTVPMLCIGRFFMLIAYILFCYRSIRITPVGKSVFAGVSLLPMCLMLSSAISYDGVVIIASLAFTAAVLRLYKEPNSILYLAESAIWAFVIGGVKGGGYLVLLLLMILFTNRNWKRSIKLVIIVCLAGILSVILFDLILPDNRLFQFGEEGKGKLTTSWGLLHPLEYFNMCVRTFLDYADSLTIDMGGTVLAWLESTIKTVLVVGLVILTGVESIFEIDDIRLQKKDRNVFCLTIFIMFYFTPFMLLSWTAINSVRIEGVQGRYFLPVLPLIFMVFTKFRMKNATEKVDRHASEAIIIRCQRLFAMLSAVGVFYMMRLYLTR